MNRRGFLKKATKIAAVTGLSGSVFVALDEMAEAGCYKQYTGGTFCSHGNWYREYRQCCSTYNGQLSCGGLQWELYKTTSSCWM